MGHDDDHILNQATTGMWHSPPLDSPLAAAAAAGAALPLPPGAGAPAPAVAVKVEQVAVGVTGPQMDVLPPPRPL